MRDFTETAYLSIIDAALAAGYSTSAVVDWFEGKPEVANAERVLVLRHDVDRRPGNALAIAQGEAKRGVRATYYFRIVPAAYNTSIIADIAALGHEIGYHYEDFHLSGYDAKRAIQMFADHLARLRAIAPVKTIAMHGSPLARHNNMKLWETERFESHGVKDCILSHDWRDFVFFTDTGRTFGATTANLRDTIGGKTAEGVATSAEVAAHLGKVRPARVQLSTHPERWNEAMVPWVRQAAIDHAANTVKRVLRIARNKGTAQAAPGM